MGNVSNSDELEGTKECQICSKQFNIRRKKHHCYGCRDVICSECSSESQIQLKIYGSDDKQSVCIQCLPLLNNNGFRNALKQINKFKKYSFNPLYSINPTMYNNICSLFNDTNNDVIQLSPLHYFAILIPYTFHSQKNNNKQLIKNEEICQIFDVYKLWKIEEQKQLSYPNSIQLLYSIAMNKNTINENDNFIFLPQNIYCYKLGDELYILPQNISVQLKTLTLKWKQRYRQQNLKQTPITKHDIFYMINNQCKHIYNIQSMLINKYDNISRKCKSALEYMVNGQYNRSVLKLSIAQTQFQNAYKLFVQHNQNAININVNEYVKFTFDMMKKCKIDHELCGNGVKCAFCKRSTKSAVICYELKYCIHKYCLTCIKSTIILWSRFNVNPVCIVNGCYAPFKHKKPINLPLDIQNKLYLMEQSTLCNISIESYNYHKFIMNTLNTLDNNLWNMICPKLRNHNSMSDMLIKACSSGIQYHENMNGCDQKQNEKQEINEFVRWKTRYLFEIGVLMKRIDFRNKYICYFRCVLNYSLSDIEIYLNEFIKQFDNYYEQIFIDTICSCYKKHKIDSDSLGMFVSDLLAQLDMDNNVNYAIFSKIKSSINELMDEKHENDLVKKQSIGSRCACTTNDCSIVMQLISVYKNLRLNDEIDDMGYTDLYDIFYHCLLHHNKNEINNLLNTKYEPNKALQMNHRHNSQRFFTSKQELYECYDVKYEDNKTQTDNQNMQLILKIRLIDKIHCYYFDNVSSDYACNNFKQLNDMNVNYNVTKPFYNCLKDEILNDFNLSLSKIDWNLLMDECKLIYQSMYSKNSYYYTTTDGDQFFDSVSLIEIVAVKLHTDFKQLRDKMQECFIKQNVESFKYYFHWNKLLKLVCSNGKTNHKMRYFLCVENNSIRESINGTYIGPFNLFSSLNIKQIDNYSSQHTIEVKFTDQTGCFDMKLMSKYPQKHDILCYDPSIEIAICNSLNFDIELFNNIDINNIAVSEKCKSITSCLSTQRIKRLFFTLFKQPNKIIEIYENDIVDYYGVISVINDYIHITDQHNQFLEDIYDLFELKCDLETCISMHRNEANRNTQARCNSIIDLFDQMHNYLFHTFDSGCRLSKDELLLINERSNNNNDKKDACHVFHRMKQILHNKRERFRKCIPNDRVKKHKKFVTIINEPKHDCSIGCNDNNLFSDVFYSSLNEFNIQSNTLDMLHTFVTECEYDSDAIKYDLLQNSQESNICKYINDISANNDLLEVLQYIVQNELSDNRVVYCFSHRFYYWEYYKDKNYADQLNPGFNASDLYVSNRYTDLKQELLQNNVCTIDENEWNKINFKANNFIQSEYIKQLKCTIYHGAQYEQFGVNKDFKISLNHLIAIVSYCDFDNLSFNFSSTFRYSSSINTLSKLKKYHANYHWCARYLRELVELFGKEYQQTISKFNLYHGISQLMIFNATVAHFCHPTSTTKQIEVAQLFATNQGIIIQVHNSSQSVSHMKWGINTLIVRHSAKRSVPFFECSFISKYSNESECLFIGGENVLEIVNIINCEMNIEYGKYLKAMNAFEYIMGHHLVQSSRKWDGFDERNLKVLFDEPLLQDLIENNTKTIPKYIADIFDKYKDDTKMVKIDIGFTYKCGGKYLQSLLLTSPNDINNSFLNLDRICRIFKNCQEIIIKTQNLVTINIDESYLLLILSQLRKLKYMSHKLTSIEFVGSIDVDFKCLQLLKMKYENEYFNVYTIDKSFKTYLKITKMSCLDDEKMDDMNIFENMDEEENLYCRNLFECKHIKRIKRLLSLDISNALQIYEKQMHIYYNITSILNDYIHIVSVHKYNLEEIIDILKLNRCNLHDCTAVKMQYRHNMMDMSADEDNVLIYIFNQIHNYFHHTFDCGLRLLENEKLPKSEIDCICGKKMKCIRSKYAYGGNQGVSCDECKRQTNDTFNEMIYNCPKNECHQHGADLCLDCFDEKINADNNEIHLTFQHMKNLLKHKIDEFNKITKYNQQKYCKFVTEIQEEEQIPFSSDTKNISYSNEAKDNNIENKYIDLKTEMLQNDIFCIDHRLWQYVKNRSQKYFATYCIKRKDKIALHHLICIILYCDYTELSYHLTLSMKYSSTIKTFQQLKSYHSNYYWFSKYLIQLVHFFGRWCGRNHFVGYFYHGLNKSFHLGSTAITFSHPVSTTKTLEIVNYYMNDCKNDGMVLKLRHQRGSFMDCSIISTNTNENECLFIEYTTLNLKDIIMHQHCIQYGKYFNLLNMFIQITTGKQSYSRYSRPKDIIITADIECIFKSLILKDEMNYIPPFIYEMFDKCLNQIKIITIKYWNILKSNILCSLLLTSPNNITKSFINLEGVCKLFPNLQKIIVDTGWRVTVNLSYMLLLLSYLEKCDNWMNDTKSFTKIELVKMKGLEQKSPIKTNEILDLLPPSKHCKIYYEKYRCYIDRK